MCLVLGAIAIIWLVVEMQPRHQAAKAFDTLIASAEARNWKSFRSVISNQYRDQWGMGADQLVEGASEALRQFFTLDIQMTQPQLTVVGNSAEVRCRPRLTGTGTPLAQMLVDRSAALQQDTVLTFRRESWKPWDWKLVSVAQPEVDLSAARDAIF